MIFIGMVAATVTAFVIGRLGYEAARPVLTRWAFEPDGSFSASAVPAPDYAEAAAWAARPDQPGSAALQAPPGFAATPRPAVDVFFVPPTTYLGKEQWNGPLDDAEANRRLDQSLRHQASAFNAVGAIWAPRYRQATFGAFLSRKPDARQALDLAFHDVSRAFDAFLAGRNHARPFVLAGHSQGAVHLLRLLKARVAGTPLAGRMVAAYVIGWPVSLSEDLGALPGLKPCATPAATRCVLGWQSFGVPADPEAVEEAYDDWPGLSGKARAGTPKLCVNPLTGWQDTRGARDLSNMGALPFATTGTPLGPLVPHLVGAACRPDGFLQLSASPGPPWRELVMPGENYHTYDLTLFWANLRADAQRRVDAFGPVAAPRP